LDTEFSVNFANVSGMAIQRSLDGLLTLCVIQVASISIVYGQYGEVSAAGAALRWYGFAALYGVATWVMAGVPKAACFSWLSRAH
jgi:hypothetical protein